MACHISNPDQRWLFWLSIHIFSGAIDTLYVGNMESVCIFIFYDGDSIDCIGCTNQQTNICSNFDTKYNVISWQRLSINSLIRLLIYSLTAINSVNQFNNVSAHRRLSVEILRRMIIQSRQTTPTIFDVFPLSILIRMNGNFARCSIWLLANVFN